jgi:hypothetical protein
MKAAVAKSTPGRLKEFEEINEAYDGNPALLQKWLEVAGSDNPFTSCERMRLRTSKFRVTRGEDEERVPIGDSASGHRLYGQLFQYTHVADFTRTFESGSQLVTKIVEAFGTKQQKAVFTNEGRKEIKERKQNQFEDASQHLGESLAEIISQAKGLEGDRSEILKQRAEAILALESEIGRLVHGLDKLRYGQANILAEPTFFVEKSKGGTLFTWLKREYDTLPAGIKNIYDMFDDEFVEVPEGEHRFLLSALMAYESANRYIEREVVLGGFEEDIALWERLADEQPNNEVIMRVGTPDLSEVRGILAKNEVTRLEASDFIQKVPVDQFRYELNKSYLDKFRAEVEETLERMEPLFVKDGRWCTDSVGVSVPMGRLRNSAYAAPLVREEFNYVRNLLRQRTLAKGDEEEMLKSFSISQMRELVNGVVQSGRKIKVMDDLFERKKVVVDDMENVDEEEQKKWKKDLRNVRGKRFKLKEDFQERFGYDLDDFMTRCNEHVHQLFWQDKRWDVRQLAKQGLYDAHDSMNEVYEPACAALDKLDLVSTKEGALADAIAVLPSLREHPRLVNVEVVVDPKKSYLVREDADQVLSQAEVYRELQRLDAEGDYAPLQARKTEYSGKTWLKKGSATKMTEVERVDFDELPFEELNGVQYHSNDHLEILLGELDENYVATEDLPAGWMKKAKFVTSQTAYPLLHKMSLLTSSTASQQQLFNADEDTMYSSELVAHVDDLHDRLADSVVIVPEVVTSGLSALAQGDFEDSYTIQLVGTTQNDGDGRLRTAFREFQWKNFQWKSRGSQTKVGVAGLTERLQAYNQAHGAHVQMRLERYE